MTCEMVLVPFSEDDCIVHYSVKFDAFDGESFADFIEELIEKYKRLNHEKMCFVMDNVRMHKTEERIREQCSANDIDLLFLSVYSPKLNPIEHVFSVLKAHIKNLLRTKYYDQLLELQKAQWGFKARTREKIINDALNESLHVIDTTLMKELWENILKVFGKVFDDDDI